jgi:hypothetical protein
MVAVSEATLWHFASLSGTVFTDVEIRSMCGDYYGVVLVGSF